MDDARGGGGDIRENKGVVAGAVVKGAPSSTVRSICHRT